MVLSVFKAHFVLYLTRMTEIVVANECDLRPVLYT